MRDLINPIRPPDPEAQPALSGQRGRARASSHKKTTVGVESADQAIPVLNQHDLAASHDANFVLGDGWVQRDDGQRWTFGRTSELILRHIPLSGGVLRLVVEPVTRVPEITGQILRVHMDGIIVGRWIITSRSVLEISINKASGRLHGLPITLEQPCFFCPALATGAASPDPLAIRLHSIEVTSDASKESSLAPLEWPSAGPEDAAPEPYRFKLGDYHGLEFDSNWSADEDGWLWTTSRSSSFKLPRPRSPACSQLQLSIIPARVRSLTDRQRLTVVANGFVVSQAVYVSETTIVIPLPSEIFAGQDSLTVIFLMPDAIGLTQFRDGNNWPRLGFSLLAAAVETCDLPSNLVATHRDDELGQMRALSSSAKFGTVPLPDLSEAILSTLGRPLKEILTSFESLGDNCSFGIVQRKAGVEVLGLFRFGSSSINAVLQGLGDGLEALRSKSEFTMAFGDGRPREHLVRVERYGLQWHTFRYENELTAEQVLEENTAKIQFLRRKFVDGLAAGRKAYVLARTTNDSQILLAPTPDGRFFRYFSREPIRLSEALAAWCALNRSGPRVLLFITPATNARPGGSVDCLAPGLYRGYAANLMISDRLEVEDHADWLRLLASCRLLMQPSSNG